MTDAFIFDGLRSPFGRFAGALSRLRPDDLAGQVISGLMARAGVPGDLIEDVILGNTNQAGEDSRNLARHAALLANLPVTVPGITVNRLCGSGMAAVIDAGRCTQASQGSLFIAGGAETMSRAPWVIAKAESAFSRQQPVEDSMIGARFPNPSITRMYGNPTMPETADRVARELGISREECDLFAEQSQSRYQKALSAQFFDNEILPIRTPGASKRDDDIIVTQDEHPRAGTTREKLQQLRTLHEGGVVTAGNASGINDGAAALLVGSLESGSEFGLQPKARIGAAAVAGIEPGIMGLGPVPAINKVLARAQLDLNQMDIIEINEAFAAQVIGCCRQLNLGAEDERLNPNGGAIALGHPLGASGARIAITATNELHRRQGRYALLSMCIGVGQGIALILERV